MKGKMKKMDNISLKKSLISSYYVMPSTEALAGNSIIVVTPCGIITGKPLSDNESDSNIDFMQKVNSSITENYRTDSGISNDQAIPGSDGFFMLKDAKIISGSVTTNIGFINVFYDQVIGISLGNLDN